MYLIVELHIRKAYEVHASELAYEALGTVREAAYRLRSFWHIV